MHNKPVPVKYLRPNKEGYSVRIYQALPPNYPRTIEPLGKNVLLCMEHKERMTYIASINVWACPHCTNGGINIASVPRALALEQCDIVA
jgi:hypothetical protein